LGEKFDIEGQKTTQKFHKTAENKALIFVCLALGFCFEPILC